MTPKCHNLKLYSLVIYHILLIDIDLRFNVRHSHRTVSLKIKTSFLHNHIYDSRPDWDLHFDCPLCCPLTRRARRDSNPARLGGFVLSLPPGVVLLAEDITCAAARLTTWA